MSNRFIYRLADAATNKKIMELERELAKLRQHAEAMYREIKNPQQDSELVADHYRADFPEEK